MLEDQKFSEIKFGISPINKALICIFAVLKVSLIENEAKPAVYKPTAGLKSHGGGRFR